MMRRSVQIGSYLALAVGLTACQEPLTEPVQPPVEAAPEMALSTSAAFGLERGVLQLPAGARIGADYAIEVGPRAIDPSDHVCPASTPITDWFLDSAYDIIDNEPSVFSLLYNSLLADQVVMYEALYLLEDDAPQYFGYEGEYTQVMTRTFRDAKRFWDIESSDIQLIGMHGSMLQDAERVAATYEFVWGMPPATAALYASMIQNAIAQSETVNGGDHPLFSFNAFAISAPGFIPDKIVMGDGMLAGYAALGFSDIAPQGIFAHEFAHHIQFENDYFDDEFSIEFTTPEQTRYTELMADAMSAYYLTHKRGLAANKHRVEEFLRAFYEIGDCGYTSDGHHGTPNQRMRAAQFGFEIADKAHKQGHILTSEAFYQLFLEAYPEIVAPDAI